MIKGMTVFNTDDVNTTRSPMFFGPPLGVQRYDVYKYPEFDKLTQQQLSFFWRPEEVSLQKDRSDYLTLRPEQKHIFTSNLKYQILLDSVQGRGPGMAFIPYCSLPELESCMTVWEFMEMIHSRSYTHIIKNVYANPSEVFDTIINDEMILERASSVTESYDEFINSAQQYGSTELWKFANEGVDLGKDERHELKRKLYRAVMNVNILEGIRFYVSFACSFAFGELKLMEGSAKIISLISRDESCFVKGTEILTTTGWKKFEDLNKTELVAQYKADGSIEFVRPSHYTRKHHKGLIYQFSDKNHQFNQAVTPDHRIIWKDTVSGEIMENTAEKYKPTSLKEFISTGFKNEGRDSLTYDERLKIAIQAVGIINDDGGNSISFNLNRLVKKERLEHFLEHLDCNYEIDSREPENEEFWLPDLESNIDCTIQTVVDTNGLEDFSWVDLNSVSGHWCREFIEELSKWDRNYFMKMDYGINFHLTVKGTQAADKLQAIAALSGWTCYQDNPFDDCYYFSIRTQKETYSSETSDNVVKTYDYDDEVFCVTVPSGMIVVRYDDKVVVSGNCHLNITQKILNKWSKGDDPEMIQIIKEEEPRVYKMFETAVNEEKRWATYLFKGGSMIGLNDKLLCNYVEWIANRRMKAIGLRPVYEIPAKNNPLPWTEHWLNSRNVQEAPMETEKESYLVGAIKQDIEVNAFADFKL